MTYFVNLTKGLKIGRNSVDLVQNKTDDVQNLDPQICNYHNTKKESIPKESNGDICG